MTHTLAYSEALERITIAAKGREDYVNAIPLTPNHPEWTGEESSAGLFASCQYLNTDSTPSCIVGTAWAVELIDAGLTPTSYRNTEAVITVLSDLLNMTLTCKAAAFLTTVQMQQDSGCTWGEAIQSGINAAKQFSDDKTYSKPS